MLFSSVINHQLHQSLCVINPCCNEQYVARWQPTFSVILVPSPIRYRIHAEAKLRNMQASQQPVTIQLRLPEMKINCLSQMPTNNQTVQIKVTPFAHLFICEIKDLGYVLPLVDLLMPAFLPIIFLPLIMHLQWVVEWPLSALPLKFVTLQPEV